MNPTVLTVIKLAAAFMIGAIPFAVIAMWGSGIDIRKAGSGNPGFNNVWRVTNFKRGLVSLVGDLSKGGIGVYLLAAPGDPEWFRWALGLAAVAGHCWSPLLGFNGGKGVATMAGALLYLAPPITAVSLALYPTLRWLGRKMAWAQEGAISSMTTMTVIAVAVWYFRGPESGVFAAVGLGIVVIRHASNIRQILGK